MTHHNDDPLLAAVERRLDTLCGGGVAGEAGNSMLMSELPSSKDLIARTRAVAALERDLASVAQHIHLYRQHGSWEQTERNEIHAHITERITRIQQVMNTSLTKGSAYNDDDFLAELNTDATLLTPILETMHTTNSHPSSLQSNYDKLISVCTGFNQHLAALRRFYKTFGE
jgi:hypothetical protein